MNISELFILLGVKGSEKTLGTLGAAKKGLGEMASMSLEAKAGIVAALYAVEKLFAASGHTGTGLTNFNAVLGLSTKTLQQYQYAARQAGVSNQEVENSFRGLQSTMTKTLMGEGVPKGLARLAQLTGGINPKDILKFQQNPALLMQRLQEYSQRESNSGFRNEVLKSFGIGDNMIAAFTRNAFSQNSLNRAPVYTDKEIGSLDRANIAWSNLGNKIEMAVGQFNARHGLQLVQDISKVTDSVIKLVESLTKLSEKLKIFTLIGKIFEGWAKISEGATGGVDEVTGAIGDKKKAKQLGMDTFEVGKNMIGYLANIGVSIADSIVPPDKGLFAPKAAPTGGSGVTVNQNLHFQHDGKDHQRTSDSVKQSVRDAYRQMSAQGQGS